MAQAQDSLAGVRGVVKSNEFPHLPLYPVNLQLTNGSETITTNTNQSGEFKFHDLRPGEVSIKLSLPGFVSRSDTLALSPGINILLFNLDPIKDTIVASVVTSSRQIMREVGDTTVIAAKHIDTMDGDSAMEMIRQVPGMRISRRGISFNGKPVKRTYVNGTLIYGDDTKAALGSLYAGDVTEVKIYEETSPEDRRRGNTSGIKETVMNLITSQKFLKASDASVSLSAGTARRYSGLQKAQLFSERLIVKEFLVADNINPSMIEVAAIDPTTRGPIVSDTRRIDGGVAFERHWKDRLYGNSLSVSAGYTNEKSSYRQATERYYLDETLWGNLRYQDSTSRKNLQKQIVADIVLDMKDTKIKSWTLSNHLEFASLEDETTSATRKYDGTGLAYCGLSSNADNRRNWNYTGSFSWSDNDHARFRPSLHFKALTGGGRGTGSIVDTLPTSILQRMLHLTDYQQSLTLEGGASVSNVLLDKEGRSLSMDTEYLSSFSRMTYSKDAWDYFEAVDEPKRDIINTRDYSESQFLNSLRLSMTFLTDKWRATAGLSGKLDKKTDEERFPEPVSDITKTFPAICPDLKVQIGNNFKLELTTSAVAPTLGMLRDRTDNVNPFFIVKGNPQLDQEYTFNASAAYNKTVFQANSSFSIRLNGAISDKSLAMRTYADGPSVVTTYDNAPGRKYLNLSLGYRKIITKRRLTIGSELSLSASGSPQYISDNLVNLGQYQVNWMTNARWQYKKKLFVSGLLSLRGMSESGGRFESRRISESLSLSGGYNFGGGRFNLAGRYDVFNTNCLSGYGMDQVSQDLSLKLGWWIKKQTIELSLSGHDLLQNAVPYTHQMTAAYEQISTNSVMGRYLMLNFRYIFKRKL